MSKKPKVLFYDIETQPNIGYVWGMYEQNVLSYVKEWQLLSFAYKWQGEKEVFCITRAGQKTDKALVKKLWKLLNSADIVIAHNGDEFDNKKASAKFLEYGLTPPSPFQSVDTLKVARRYFKLNSNKLNDLGTTLKVGRKVVHTGFDLWLGCMKNDAKSWATMEKYNKQDVVLLEKVYNKLLPWINTHPNVAFIAGSGDGCPKCGSTKLQSRGFRCTRTSKFQQYQCMSCGGWCRARLAEKGIAKPEVA